MADDLSKRGKPDRDRINMNEPFEVGYWKSKFNVTEAELANAVGQVGNMAKDVENFLKKR